MKVAPFFENYPVFTFLEFAGFLHKTASRREKNQAHSLLTYHLKAGHLLYIRRNFYAVVPRGTENAIGFSVDPYLVCAKIKNDAVLAYHTALALRGNTYSIRNYFTYLSYRESPDLIFQNSHYKAITFPLSLMRKKQELYGVEAISRMGISIRATSFERTLVDMLDRPDLCGGWEEVWRSLESVEYFDVEKIIHYVYLLDRSRTAALVGFYLEQHKKQLRVQENALQALEKYRPKSCYYLDRKSKEPARLYKRWNLIVPLMIAKRQWEEVSQWS